MIITKVVAAVVLAPGLAAASLVPTGGTATPEQAEANQTQGQLEVVETVGWEGRVRTFCG